jgi:hypothetical protein
MPILDFQLREATFAAWRIRLFEFHGPAENAPPPFFNPLPAVVESLPVLRIPGTNVHRRIYTHPSSRH